MRAVEAERLSGGLLVGGFQGTLLDDDLNRKIREHRLGGVILFKRNITDLGQVQDLNHELASSASGHAHFIIAVDQEGGRVARLGPPAVVLPPARTLASLGSSSITRRLGRLVGRELRGLGFNLDFAPVLDVSSDPENTVIGDRSFGSLPEEAARHGIAFGRGLLDGGVVPCAKHFPGHGVAAQDSHLVLPSVDRPLERLMALDAAPFQDAIRAALPVFMTAHVIYSALDPGFPATLSRKIISGLLRRRLGFKGVLFSDDLEMGAIASTWSAAEAAVLALDAGCDALLVCRDADKQDDVLEALARKAVRSLSFRSRLEEASKRLQTLFRRFPPSPRANAASWIASPRHQQAQSRLLSAIRLISCY